MASLNTGKIYLTLRRKRIYIVYSNLGERLRKSTGIACEPEHFEDGKILETHPNYASVIGTIEALKSKISFHYMKLVSEGVEPTKAEMENSLQNKESKKSRYSIVQALQTYYTEKELEYSDTTIRSRQSVIKKYKEFEQHSRKEWAIHTVDKYWYEKLIYYLLVIRNNNVPTANLTIKYLKASLRSVAPENKWTFIKTIPEAREIPIFLDTNECEYLKKVRLPKAYRKVRDLFVACMYTGMRYSDSQLFRPSWIKDEKLIVYNAKKTGAVCKVPVFKGAKKIMEAYGWEFPKLSGPYYNEALKNLFLYLGFDRYVEKLEYIPVESPLFDKKLRVQKESKLVPLYEAVTSHVARKTFVVNCLRNNMSPQNVMKMVGHMDYKSFQIYFDVADVDIINESNKVDW